MRRCNMNMMEDPKFLRQTESPHRIAFVHALWHQDIVRCARETFVLEMLELGHSEANFAFFEVAGAFEIPFHVKRLAETEQFDAIVACAFVVNGGIYRHDFVSSAVIDGLMRVQLDTGVPVFSAVLTPHNFHESEEHVSFFREHFAKKGREVARACVDTLSKLAFIPR